MQAVGLRQKTRGNREKSIGGYILRQKKKVIARVLRLKARDTTYVREEVCGVYLSAPSFYRSGGKH